MRTVILRSLSAEQDEPWEFRLSPRGDGGGVVSVPAKQRGYPIDWPPQSASQAAWLHAFAPDMEARAGAAWYLAQGDWERLVERLEAQAEREAGSGSGSTEPPP